MHVHTIDVFVEQTHHTKHSRCQKHQHGKEKELHRLQSHTQHHVQLSSCVILTKANLGIIHNYQHFQKCIRNAVTFTPPMGDRLVAAVGLMGSEDPADSAF